MNRDDRECMRRKELERERLRQEEALDEALKNTFPFPIRFQSRSRSSPRLPKPDRDTPIQSKESEPELCRPRPTRRYCKEGQMRPLHSKRHCRRLL